MKQTSRHTSCLTIGKPFEPNVKLFCQNLDLRWKFLTLPLEGRIERSFKRSSLYLRLQVWVKRKEKKKEKKIINQRLKKRKEKKNKKSINQRLKKSKRKEKKKIKSKIICEHGSSKTFRKLDFGGKFGFGHSSLSFFVSSSLWFGTEQKWTQRFNLWLRRGLLHASLRF